MLAYVVRRVVTGLVMLIVMSFVTYFLFFAANPSAAKFACGKQCSEAQIAQTKKGLGYDKPVIQQWAEFVKGVVAGRQYPEDKSLRETAPNLVSDCAAPCLGYSRQQTKTVRDIITADLPISMSLAFMAFFLWIIGGVLLGIIAALTKGSLIDRGVVGTSLLFFAFPTFFIGKFFLNFVSIKWGLIKVPVYTTIHDGGLFTWLQGLFLPGLTLALVFLASYVRITRAFVIEAGQEDYTRTARAKGLNTPKIIFKHTMRAALTPLVTMAGIDLAGLLGGAIITETVFNYNGLGKAALQATILFDLPTTVGIVLVLATFVILANIIVDLLYAVIDPRVRVG